MAVDESVFLKGTHPTTVHDNCLWSVSNPIVHR